MKLRSPIGSLRMVLVLFLTPGILASLGATASIVSFPYDHPVRDCAEQIFDPVIALWILLVMLAGAAALAAMGPRENRIRRIFLVAGIITLVDLVVWFVCGLFLVFLLLDF